MLLVLVLLLLLPTYVIVQHDLGGVRHQGAWLDCHKLLLPDHGIPNLHTKQQTITTAVVKPTT
jgi:hypothetical protein